MQSSNEEGEDLFFDSYDCIGTSYDAASSDDSVIGSPKLDFRKLDYDFWTNELISIRERRDRFFHRMGFEESVSSQLGCTRESEETTVDKAGEQIGLERVTEISSAVLDSLSSPDDVQHSDSVCYIRDLDSGKKFIVHDLGQDGLFSMLKEEGSDRMMTLQEFETFLGLSRSVQQLLRREVTPSGEKHDESNDARKKGPRSWWKSFTMRRYAVGMCKNDVSVKHPKLHKTMRTRVQHHRKRCMEFTALYMGQEIQAHKGLIRTMKFSPSGWYLASGGEDCVVRIWQVTEVEASCKCLIADGSSKFVDKVKEGKLMLGRKAFNSAPVVIPKKVFKIEETPRQECLGHTSDILDLCWSKSDCLLTSSKDKTVRLWKVGCNECLKVFHHNDYVTCVQFNPVDDRYFITGSIDRKVRIWGVSENRVVDWTDVRDIVTAVCYKPDGKGFVVGSIAGNCHFYDFSGDNMQLDMQLCIQGRKKSTGKRITGLQFSPEDSQRVMITSADSKVRIFDGVDVIHKFRGLRKSKSQLSAAFTADGRYIVSVDEDSHVYIWNYNGLGVRRSKGAKSNRSCELFFSEGVSIAVPWPGTGQRAAGLSKNTLHPELQNFLEPSTWLRDPDRFSLGAWFFADGPSRGSATWPEEKLLPPPESSEHTKTQPNQHHHHHHQCQHHHHYYHLTSMSGTWSSIIVTAGNDGTIRSFHNYGLPVRL